jgi:hypothetical protein
VSVRSRPGALIVGNPWFPHDPPPPGATAVKFQPLVAQRAEAPGSDPGGSWFESTRGDQQRAQRRSMRRRSIGRTPGCYPVHAGSTPAVAASQLPFLQRRSAASAANAARFRGLRVADPRGSGSGTARQAPFLGRLTAGSSALNRRMRGSNPARGALLRTRPWWPGGLQPRAGEGSIPSVRASSPGLLVDRGCQPLKPATRVRIPLGALRGDDAAVVSTAACGRAMPAVRVRTPPAASTLWLSHRNHMRGSGANGNTRGLHP